LLVENFEFLAAGGQSEKLPLIAFADFPADARSACVATVSDGGIIEDVVMRARPIGSPYVLALRSEAVEWWLQKREKPVWCETIPTRNLDRFFDERKQDFAPDRVFRAKSRGLFQQDQQLTFVDAGLMPLIESEMGERLSELMGRVISTMLDDLGQPNPSENTASRVFQSAFWLLAGKMLRDKRVPLFKSLDLKDANDVFGRVGRHYGMPNGLPPLGVKWTRALANATTEFSNFASLGNVTTESLAYLYESTLVPRSVRKALGIHSTPSYLVDYMVWQMADWIEELPEDKRHVFEPACGHGGFLVACVRLLRELLGDVATEYRKTYLRRHVHGLEIDDFASEIARLSLTLADIPNPNGWDLRKGDMFASDALMQEASRAGIIFANPPFENLTVKDRTQYARSGFPTSQVNKAAEMIARILPAMQPGAVLGLVVPQGLLHSKGAKTLRETFLGAFEIREITSFPDKVFKFADSESAVILCRSTNHHKAKRTNISFRSVREVDWPKFRTSYRATWTRLVEAGRLAGQPDCSLRVPELSDLWDWLRAFDQLSTIASVGQGMEFRGRDLPKGLVPISNKKRSGDVPGFANVSSCWEIHQLPRRVWMTSDAAAIRRLIMGRWTGKPQVIVNYAPVSRGPWRLKAGLDRGGHALTSRFLAVRPLTDEVTPEYLWALCNSPVANAFIYCHTMKRDILAGTLRSLPVPSVSSAGVERVSRVALAYLNYLGESDTPLQAEPDMARAKGLLLAMDAEVLRLYDLPPRLERQLLDLFTGHQRAGVPFPFTSYYPPEFRPYLPLHMIVSEDYERSTAGELRERVTPETSGTVLKALATAVESFKEE